MVDLIILVIITLILEHLVIACAFFNQEYLIRTLKICKKNLSNLCSSYKTEAFEAEKRATKHFAKLQAIEKVLNNTNDYKTLVCDLKKILANPTIN